MNAGRAMLLVILLALLSIGGLIGMVLAHSAWADGLLLSVAALPLAVGLWRWRGLRRR